MQPEEGSQCISLPDRFLGTLLFLSILSCVSSPGELRVLGLAESSGFPHSVSFGTQRWLGGSCAPLGPEHPPVARWLFGGRRLDFHTVFCPAEESGAGTRPLLCSTEQSGSLMADTNAPKCQTLFWNTTCYVVETGLGLGQCGSRACSSTVPVASSPGTVDMPSSQA